jgi:protein-tyrosine phosphatase
MARAMEHEGIRVVAATPHVREDFPTTPEAMEHALLAVRAVLAHAGVRLEVLPGAEISLESLAGLDVEARRRFGLGGSPRVLLLECPYVGWPLALAGTVSSLMQDGVVPVLAHPERNSEVQEDPTRLAELVERGALVQLTAASVDGRFGKRTAATARRLLDVGLAHLLASDAHGPSVREAGLSRAVKALRDPALAEWLTEEVPGAILRGERLPPRPPRRRRAKFDLFRGGR